MADRHRSVLLFGAPGVGKGTQGKILGCVPGFVHIAMGDLFRSLDPESAVGQTVRAYSSKGELVPDEITIELWRTSVDGFIAAGDIDTARDVLVLDGVPRNVQQALMLDAHIEPVLIVHLDTDDETAMFERMRRRALEQGRADDAKDDVIRRRWDVFRSETAPVLQHYDAGLIARIEALGTPLQVLGRIVAQLMRTPGL